ncbi:uncharacterized protein LOC108743267 isoform X2 [Agrilus planipennis]|uniref:Uncharacterized protein LOC108743267 isoform X2 n=1 Tax=Agrilus planipennis TaxID=224129 RepID=A0A1W4XPF2_AGRPL|nr:uncharacterized protein LOC108743267 isoform X2 [Agrilus planipennis]
MLKISQIYSKIPQKASIVQLYQYLRQYASAPVSAVSKLQVKSHETHIEGSSSTNLKVSKITSKNPLVAAAFASLGSKAVEEIKTPRTDERIKGAQTVEELLNLSEGSGLSRRFALKIVSVLADWCTDDKIQLSDFDRDPRFVRLCKVLTKKPKANLTPHNEDLTMVVNITADDEAARLINGLTIPQMVRVVMLLASKKRRSVSLLRSISFNISRSQEHLDLKQCADLLFGAASLNYIDDILLDKICRDICSQLKENKRGSAVIGSILTSLGLIRYKDPVVLDAITEWVLCNAENTRAQDAFALFLTLAITNHRSEKWEKLNTVFVSQLSQKDALKLSTWLDFVWSLVVLEQATDKHIESVLTDSFTQKVEIEFQVPHKLKILNINAAANLLYNDYKGSKLSDSSNIYSAVPLQSKNKKALAASIIETLGLGLLIEGECLIDRKGNPLPFNKKSDECIRVAVVVYDFHDMCRGKIEPTGMHHLFERLLHAEGYKVLAVPYTEYNPHDKLVQRIQFLKNKFKAIT